MEGETFSIGESVRFNHVFDYSDGQQLRVNGKTITIFKSMSFDDIQIIERKSENGNHQLNTGSYFYPPHLLLKMPEKEV